jgi:hypothetical protein
LFGAVPPAAIAAISLVVIHRSSIAVWRHQVH